MTDIEDFKGKFKFNPETAFNVGIERECFIVDVRGNIVPLAVSVIEHVTKNGWCTGLSDERVSAGSLIGYELSACQIETRTNPCHVEDLSKALRAPSMGLRSALRELGLSPRYQEVAPDDMPLDVYPDPTGRYAQISASMSREKLLAACQVAGTHVHVGMPDHDTALRVYNGVIQHCGKLCQEGDGSNGRRLEIYRKVAEDRDPPPYVDWENFCLAAESKGFAKNPRDCWTLIRISVHGTIEFRMFGTTPSLPLIEHWARSCHFLCKEAAK